VSKADPSRSEYAQEASPVATRADSIGAMDPGPMSRRLWQPSRRALVTGAIGLILIGSIGVWLVHPRGGNEWDVIGTTPKHQQAQDENPYAQFAQPQQPVATDTNPYAQFAQGKLLSDEDVGITFDQSPLPTQPTANTFSFDEAQQPAPQSNTSEDRTHPLPPQMSFDEMPDYSQRPPSMSTLSGNVWVAFCSKSASEAELETCVSYTRGVADTITMLQKALPERARTCIPNSATASDLAALAFPYVLQQPSNVRQFLATALLIAAFHEAYPCTSQPPQPIPDWAKK
jgi:Rap1a immunity proteins